MEIRSGVWLGAPLLVLGGGLRSTDEFKNVMVISLALHAPLVKFYEDVIHSYENIRRIILPLNIGGGLRSTENFQNLMDCSLYHY